jgi:hypothetical protein
MYPISEDPRPIGGHSKSNRSVASFPDAQIDANQRDWVSRRGIIVSLADFFGHRVVFTDFHHNFDDWRRAW